MILILRKHQKISKVYCRKLNDRLIYCKDKTSSSETYCPGVKLVLKYTKKAVAKCNGLKLLSHFKCEFGMCASFFNKYFSHTRTFPGQIACGIGETLVMR